jgi:hypothetical protein
VNIEELVPEAGKVDEAGLRAVPADELVRYLLGRKRPWWRRKPCALALRDRVPEKYVGVLLDRIRDVTDETELRMALLEVLPRPELLPWLQAQGPEQRYGLYEAILKARAALGDLTAVPALSTLANTPWQRQAAIGEAGLDLLVSRFGAIDAYLDDARPEDRAYKIRRGANPLAAFADPDVGVAFLAAEHASALDDELLVDHVVTGPTMEARLWAMYALHKRGRDVRELWNALERPRVEVPGLPEHIRLAILGEYELQARTDPRWRIERACTDPPSRLDEALLVANAVGALESAGLAPEPAVPIGIVNQQGGGTYYECKLRDGGMIMISNLGPFVSGYEYPPTAREALERAGYEWIGEVGDIVVTGMCVYYFGKREPLDVRTLLFYWQD